MTTTAEAPPVSDRPEATLVRTAEFESTTESLKFCRASFRHDMAQSYRIEYLLAFPLLAALFALYLRLALRKSSPTQTHEKLINSRALIVTVSLAARALTVLTFVNIPVLERLTQPHFVDVPGNECGEATSKLDRSQ
jgi:hypothetical protein